MDEIEIPHFFLCPISLQIMKDPVTTIAGITYDRESIEQWLKTGKQMICPVTKQPITSGSDLTPNHTLRRLIQAWSVTNAANGMDRIPTPKSPLSKTSVMKLIREFQVPNLCLNALKKVEVLAKENERNRKCMEETGVAEGVILFLLRCYRENRFVGLEEGLRVLLLTWTPSAGLKNMVNENSAFIDCLTWILGCDSIENYVSVKSHSMVVLRKAIEVANTRLLEKLRTEFFNQIVKIFKSKVSNQVTKSALQILINVCLLGRNKFKIIEANTVFELIEFELEKPDQKHITELIMNLLAHLCSCADGRERFLRHAGSIAMIAKRILRVSPVTDNHGVHILWLVSKYSATKEVVLEMLRVGAVTKLCMVIQADCEKDLKHKASGVLRLHSDLWNNSPCIAVYLLTRHQR